MLCKNDFKKTAGGIKKFEIDGLAVYMEDSREGNQNKRVQFFHANGFKQ
jgi:hypothetical protein